MARYVFRINPFAGSYRGASILVSEGGWVAYYPSTSNHVVGEGYEYQRDQAITKACRAIDEHVARLSSSEASEITHKGDE
jgi:hypothetical protein